jgi:HlyD family secretion protein
MTRKGARVVKGIVLVALLGGGVTFFVLRRASSDGPVTFKVGKVDRGPVEQTVTSTGQLNAVVTVQVGSQVSGIILNLGADFNSVVQEGQIIAQIDPTRIKATLEQAKAQLKNAEASEARAKVNHEQAKREWERGHALAEKKVIGEAEIDLLKSKYDVARVDLQSSSAQVAQARASVGMAKVDLERTTIRSPISGVVLQRAVDVGQTVAASLQAPTLFTIAQDLSKMEVRAAIDEADVGKLKEGLEARFTVDAYPGREFVATIHQIRSNPNVQQNVVTYDAILRVDNVDGKLRPGMTASVRIVTEKRENVLRVPNAALRFKPPNEMVLAQTGGGPPAGGPSPGDGGAAPGAGGPEGRRWAGGEGTGAGGPGGPGGGWNGRRGGEGGGGPRGGGGGGGAGRRGEGGGRIVARVYKPQGEKVLAMPFRPGISDEQFTEIARGSLEEGDELVLEASGGSMQAAPQRPAAPPGGGGMGRSRGPRFF